jgi:hypothetical protein
VSRRICAACQSGKHLICNGQNCPCEDTHDYEEPDPALEDPYVTDAAEDAYLDSLIGERFGGENVQR